MTPPLGAGPGATAAAPVASPSRAARALAAADCAATPVRRLTLSEGRPVAARPPQPPPSPLSASNGRSAVASHEPAAVGSPHHHHWRPGAAGASMDRASRFPLLREAASIQAVRDALAAAATINGVIETAALAGRRGAGTGGGGRGPAGRRSSHRQHAAAGQPPGVAAATATATATATEHGEEGEAEDAPPADWLHDGPLAIAKHLGLRQPPAARPSRQRRQATPPTSVGGVVAQRRAAAAAASQRRATAALAKGASVAHAATDAERARHRRHASASAHNRRLVSKARARALADTGAAARGSVGASGRAGHAARAGGRRTGSPGESAPEARHRPMSTRALAEAVVGRTGGQPRGAGSRSRSRGQARSGRKRRSSSEWGEGVRSPTVRLGAEGHAALSRLVSGLPQELLRVC